MSEPNYTKEEQELYESVGGQLREARIKLGLTRGQVAAKIGVTPPTVSKMETGENRMPLGRFISLCRIVRLDWRKALGDERIVAIPPLDYKELENRIHHEIAKLMLEDNSLSATVALQRAAQAVSNAVEAAKVEDDG